MAGGRTCRALFIFRLSSLSCWSGREGLWEQKSCCTWKPARHPSCPRSRRRAVAWRTHTRNHYHNLLYLNNDKWPNLHYFFHFCFTYFLCTNNQIQRQKKCFDYYTPYNPKNDPDLTPQTYCITIIIRQNYKINVITCSRVNLSIQGVLNMPWLPSWNPITPKDIFN